MNYKVSVVIEKDENGFFAYCRSFPDVKRKAILSKKRSPIFVRRRRFTVRRLTPMNCGKFQVKKQHPPIEQND